MCIKLFHSPGSVTCSPGSPLGQGLTQEAAADLGLDLRTAVGASLIDAHAGGLGIKTNVNSVMLYTFSRV